MYKLHVISISFPKLNVLLMNTQTRHLEAFKIKSIYTTCACLISKPGLDLGFPLV